MVLAKSMTEYTIMMCTMILEILIRSPNFYAQCLELRICHTLGVAKLVVTALNQVALLSNLKLV